MLDACLSLVACEVCGDWSEEVVLRVVDLEEYAGEKMNAGDCNDEQPRDLEYEGSKVYHSIVLCHPVYSSRVSSAQQPTKI
jgi:hypothetical protein